VPTDEELDKIEGHGILVDAWLNRVRAWKGRV
jgi:hypothetical protein